MAVNDEYSKKDFTNQDLTKESADDFNNSEIVGSCFFQHTVRTDVFPSAMTGVTFEKCNLDNCVIPAGNTVDKSCAHNQFIVQNDGCKWIVDASDDPTEPLNEKIFDHYSLSKDPADIPALSVGNKSVLITEREKELLQATKDEINAIADAFGMELTDKP